MPVLGTYRPSEGWTTDNTELSVWEERDRLHVSLMVSEEADRFPGVEIASWWDDDARQMFEDGFFDARRLHGSVAEYAESVQLAATV